MTVIQTIPPDRQAASMGTTIKAVLATSLQVLDVFAPNSNFSRKRPEKPIYYVCLSQGKPPCMEAIAGTTTTCDDIPVYHAIVCGDDVSLYSFENVSLPSLL